VIRGLMTDDEWAIVAPFLTIPSLHGGRPRGLESRTQAENPGLSRRHQP
jgi:hypothetical protein